jgi:DNA-binding transcriptional LysR family regulator
MAAVRFGHDTFEMPLDPRLLQPFVVLAEELHFGRAAQRLHIAQPALSQQIRRLEQQIGSELYTRNSRIVELTDSGRAMLQPARAAIRAAEQAERAAQEASRITGNPLRVGVNLHVEDVVPVVVAYASQHADVQLSLSRIDEPHGHEMLSAGLLDAVVGTYEPTEGSAVSRTHAVDVPLYALVGPHHPIARLAAAPLEDYRQSTIAILDRDYAPEQFDRYVDLLSEGQGRHVLSMREFRPTGDVPQADILLEIGAGHAVGFGTPGTFGPRAGHLRLLPFDPPLSIPTYVSWHAERSRVVDAFVDHLSALA